MSSRYLPLESNPDMLTSFIRALGVAAPARFVDVWSHSLCTQNAPGCFTATQVTPLTAEYQSFEEETLGFFPQPILAVCVLYPSSKVEPARLPSLNLLPADGSSCFYVRQRAEEVGNACGTIAVVHSICNNIHDLKFSAEDSPLLAFAKAGKGLSAESAADAMSSASFLHSATEEAAATGQTATPSAEDELDAHFIAFVRSDETGRLMELDGMKPGPVDHGDCSAEEVLGRAIKVVREDMMSRTSDVNFSVLALTTGAEEE